MEDIGVTALRFAREALSIDDDWAVFSGRGLAWWGGQLAQRLWAEPPIEEAGTTVCRLRAECDLVAGYEPTPARRQVLGAVASGTAQSALVREPGRPDRLRLAASVYVHREGLEWGQRHFAFVAALQAAQAHTLAQKLPELLSARPDASDHPEGGRREQPDEMLGLLEHVVRPRGAQESGFSEEEGAGALEEVLGPLGFAPRRDGAVTWVPFPFGDGDATLLVNPDAPHPALGRGALVRAALPETRGAPPSVDDGLAVNERELSEHTRAHLLGSWYPDGARLVHDCFLPAACRLEGLLGNLLFGVAIRLRWLDGARA
jgi:hypothetical protein